jgi:hypothetical protein
MEADHAGGRASAPLTGSKRHGSAEGAAAPQRRCLSEEPSAAAAAAGDHGRGSLPLGAKRPAAVLVGDEGGTSGGGPDACGGLEAAARPAKTPRTAPRLASDEAWQGLAPMELEGPGGGAGAGSGTAGMVAAADADAAAAEAAAAQAAEAEAQLTAAHPLVGTLLHQLRRSGGLPAVLAGGLGGPLQAVAARPGGWTLLTAFSRAAADPVAAGEAGRAAAAALGLALAMQAEQEVLQQQLRREAETGARVARL